MCLVKLGGKAFLVLGYVLGMVRIGINIKKL